MAINRNYVITFGLSLLVGVTTIIYIIKRWSKEEDKQLNAGEDESKRKPIVKVDEAEPTSVVEEEIVPKPIQFQAYERTVDLIPTDVQISSVLGDSTERISLVTLSSTNYVRSTSLEESDSMESKGECSAEDISPEVTVENGTIENVSTDHSVFVECELSLMTSNTTDEGSSKTDTPSEKMPHNNSNNSNDVKSFADAPTVANADHFVNNTGPDAAVKTKSDSSQQVNHSNEVSPSEVADTLMRLSKPKALSSISYREGVVLNYLVSFVQGKERAKILETIAGAASFSVNLPILTSSGCLKSLQSCLRKFSADRRSTAENEKIALLHSLTNISCSDDNQKILKSSVDDLFSMSEGQEDTRIGLACLCVIANLSLTNHCHPEISKYSSRLFELLEEEDTALLKQVLTILLNLCTEASTVPRLLVAQTPSELGTFVTRVGPIGKSTDHLIKWLKILRNLYKIMREENITEDTLISLSKGDLEGSVYASLQSERLHMKSCVFLLCHNKESFGLATSAKMLYEYLEITN